jgi:RNA-directed DNA polymerase
VVAGGQYESSVATLEDKIVQRAVVGVLNAVYEADFRDFSYGFRPGRRPLTRWMRWRPGSTGKG